MATVSVLKYAVKGIAVKVSLPIIAVAFALRKVPGVLVQLTLPTSLTFVIVSVIARVRKLDKSVKYDVRF